MYTGTLIRDLMAMVERAERCALQKQIIDEWNCSGCSRCRLQKCRVSRFS